MASPFYCYDVMPIFYDSAERICGSIAYRRTTFSAEYMEQFARELRSLAERFVSALRGLVTKAGTTGADSANSHI